MRKRPLKAAQDSAKSAAVLGAGQGVDLIPTTFEKPYKGFLVLYIERKETGQSGEQPVSHKYGWMNRTVGVIC